jgi:hypothetical protein
MARPLCGIVLAAAALLSALPAARAVVGDDAHRVAGRAAQSLVVVRLPHGQCTGTALAADLVLTAAHCVFPGDIRVRAYGTRKLVPVARTMIHPQYLRRESDIPMSVDLALLKLARPLPERAKAAVLARRPPTAGEAVIVAGYGLDDADAVKLTGRARMATLITLDERFGIQMQLRDPAPIAQAGACGGDSGGPAFAVRDELVVVGVVSSGPERCGGFTYVTPIGAYFGWIIETARKLGAPLAD